MKQRCLYHSCAVVPGRTHGVLFQVDQSVGMSIHCREQSLNGFHLEQASYTVMEEERSMFWKVILTVTIREKVHMNMCLILNGYRNTAVFISL